MTVQLSVAASTYKIDKVSRRYIHNESYCWLQPFVTLLPHLACLNFFWISPESAIFWETHPKHTPWPRISFAVLVGCRCTKGLSMLMWTTQKVDNVCPMRRLDDPLLPISPSCFGFKDLGKWRARHTRFICSGLDHEVKLCAYPAEFCFRTAVKIASLYRNLHLPTPILGL